MKIESRRLVVQFLVLSVALLLLSCRPDCPEAYTPYFHTSVNGLNSISIAQSVGQTMGVDVLAETINNKANSISFNIDFDSTKITYDGYLTGDFLNKMEIM
jgi:hypothetical protein